MHFDPIRFAEPSGATSQRGAAVRNLTIEEAFGVPMPGGSGTPPVTDSSAMQAGTVYACLEKLAGCVSQLPVHDYTLGATGQRQRITPPSAIWWMLNESPTDAWTASAWKAWIVRCVKLRGDQHTEIVRNAAGVPVSLMPHHPDNVQPRRVGQRLVYDVRDPDTNRVRGIDQDDMLHFTGFGFDGTRSLSAIKWAAAKSISNMLAAHGYMGKSLTSGGMPKVALEYPHKLQPDQAELVRDSFRRIYMDGEHAGKLPLVLTEGAKANTLTISAVDMELMDSLRMDKAMICEVLGVPPIIIGDSEKTSSWGTGVEQITLGWVRFGIQPLLGGWEEELNRKLYRRAGRFLEFSLAALLRGDSKAQAEAFRAALGGPGAGDGWMSVDEVRSMLNLPTLGGEFATPYRAQRDTAADPTNTSTTTPAP